ncbi:hypothetical protein TNCV_4744421 [Trichonephila clavipes]|nr:hypothetical protein TNCV_4744421 [Trichonephila clavipes]
MCPFILHKGTCFLGLTAANFCCTLLRGVQVYNEERFRVSADRGGGGGQHTKYNQSKNVDRPNYRGGGIMFCQHLGETPSRNFRNAKEGVRGFYDVQIEETKHGGFLPQAEHLTRTSAHSPQCSRS